MFYFTFNFLTPRKQTTNKKNVEHLNKYLIELFTAYNLHENE